MASETYRILQDYVGHACWTDHGFARLCEFVDQMRDDEALEKYLNRPLVKNGYAKLDSTFGPTESIMRDYANACYGSDSDALHALCRYVDSINDSYNLSGFLDEALITEGLSPDGQDDPDYQDELDDEGEPEDW